MTHTVVAEQPCNKKEESVPTLHEMLAFLEWILRVSADMLDHNVKVINNYTHWKARGGQETLDRLASHLRNMRYSHPSCHALHEALRDYMLCLEKSSSDAQEEMRLPKPKRGIPVTQWKAEGECMVLSSMCATIAQLLENYAPSAMQIDHHPLVDAHYERAGAR